MRLWYVFFLALTLVACRSREAREERLADREARREERRAARQEVREEARKEELVARQTVSGERCRAEPSTATPATARPPQPGDTWTYCLWYPERPGVSAQPARRYIVKISSVTDSEVIDEVSLEGASPLRTRHDRRSYLVTQVVSVFSPYLGLFNNLSSANFGGVEVLDASCTAEFQCEASARYSANETITIADGTFNTAKIVIRQSWRPAAGAAAGQPSAKMNGRRSLTVWYSPELRRAVKYRSRSSGDLMAVEPGFDLELVGYQLK